MKLSVIITCYNQKKYIKQAVDSVLSQKLEDDYEIIIADDGSDDGSWNFLLNEYGKYPNIKLFQMERENNVKYIAHIRASQCRVEALKYVTGQYFAYLDGDDFYCDDMAMQKKIDILDNPQNSDIILVSSGHIVYSNGVFKDKYIVNRFTEGRIRTKRYWKRYYIHANTCVFRSSIIPKLPLQIIGKIFHDNIIMFAALQYGSMYYLTDITLAYRQDTEDNQQHIWVNNNSLNNQIRQMIDLDISNQLNKNLWKETYYRYHSTVKFLLKNKEKECDKKLLELCRELSCTQTLQILNWPNNSLFQKIYILSKHFILQFCCKVQLLCRRILLQTRLQKYLD